MKAHPFAGLLGLEPRRLPKSTSSTFVVEGKPVTDVRQIDERVADAERDDADVGRARQLRKEAQRARNRERYQKDRLDPEKMAKRKAWAQANRDKVRAIQRRCKKRHAERIRLQQNEWARRKYYEDQAAAQAKAREYYARNREAILARAQAKRDAARAARRAAAEAKGTP